MTHPDSNSTPAQQSKKKRHEVASSIIYMTLAALAIGLGWVILQIYGIAASIEEQQDTNTSTVELIRDCTDPGGECFDRGQQRTAEAVVGINEGTMRVIVAALTCQEQGVTGEKALADCTARLASAD